jgi:hypothetical protein
VNRRNVWQRGEISGLQGASARKRRFVWLLVGLGVIFPAAARARVTTWGDGAWSWFGDPRAVRVVGRYDQTFVGWIDWIGNVVVGQYDARFGVLRAHVIAKLARDDHSNPSLLVEPDKRLSVFFSGHNGSHMYFRTSLRPEDNTAWGPVRRVPSLPGPAGSTYPNPLILPAEHHALWIFWRGPDYSQDYAIRTIDGRWCPARRLILGQPPPSATVPGRRPYVKVDSNGRDTIGIGFSDGHPRETISSIYYFAYRAGALWTAGGRRIARLADAPIATTRADLVYDGRPSGVSAWIHDIAFDRRGRPVIVYATFPSVFNHAYWYARWNGRSWEKHFMTRAGPSISPIGLEQQYSGGLALDHSNPSVVYLSRQVNGWFAIQKWVTGNGGASWRRRWVVQTAGVSNVRPVVPRGPDGGPMGVLWMRGHYGDYRDYQTHIAFTR